MQATDAPSTTNTYATLTPLEQAIYESVAYSDIFDYPLTASEIQRVLSVEATLADVERALVSPTMSDLLASCPPYYCLAGREQVCETRIRRRAHSDRLMRLGRSYGSLIARLPFVRMVAVTGSLAVDNADAADDVDYLIVTAPGRVWTARAFTMLIVRLAALRGLELCPNYLLSVDALALEQQDLYTARELVQMRPVAGHDTYLRFLGANPWRRDFLPNAGPFTADVPALIRPWYQRVLEAALRTYVGDRFERRIFERKAAELRREAGANDEAIFDRATCKGHFDRHRTRTGASLVERVRHSGDAL